MMGIIKPLDPAQVQPGRGANPAAQSSLRTSVMRIAWPNLADNQVDHAIAAMRPSKWSNAARNEASGSATPERLRQAT